MYKHKSYIFWIPKVHRLPPRLPLCIWFTWTPPVLTLNLVKTRSDNFGEQYLAILMPNEMLEDSNCKIQISKAIMWLTTWQHNFEVLFKCQLTCMRSPWEWTKDHGSDMTLTLGTRASMQLSRVDPHRVVMLMKVISRSLGSPIWGN